jgi:anti-sigma factor RsiW
MSPTNPELKRKLKNQAVELPMDDAFYDRLHDKIMAAVDQTEIKAVSPWEKPKKLLKAHWKSWAVSGGSVLMIMIASLQAPTLVRSFFDSSHVVQVVKNEEAFTAETIKSPEDFSGSLITSQNESDFFVDVAERSFHDLSQRHVREIMGEAGP